MSPRAHRLFFEVSVYHLTSTASTVFCKILANLQIMENGRGAYRNLDGRVELPCQWGLQYKSKSTKCAAQKDQGHSSRVIQSRVIQSLNG